MSDTAVRTGGAGPLAGLAAPAPLDVAVEAAAWREHGWALGPAGAGVLVAAVLSVSVLCGLAGLG